jgi:hypothetical protein
MKTSLSLFCAGIIFFTACTKTDLKPSQNVISSTSQDEASAVKTRSGILTAHTWMYKGFYFHYVDKNNKGDVQYVRGGTHNVINLDATRITFRPNGNLLELDGGYRYPGTWKFTDNTASVLVCDYTNWTNVCTITTITGNHLNFAEPMGYNSKSFTELIPAP